jgi:hypothetical protein
LDLKESGGKVKHISIYVSDNVSREEKTNHECEQHDPVG